MIREATDKEYEEIGQAYADHINDDGGLIEQPADLPEAQIYIVDDYISDGPGYTGPVALIHWGGAPGFVSVMVFRPAGAGYAWQFENETTDKEHLRLRQLTEVLAERDRLRAALIRAVDHLIMSGTKCNDAPEALAQARAALNQDKE